MSSRADYYNILYYSHSPSHHLLPHPPPLLPLYQRGTVEAGAGAGWSWLKSQCYSSTGFVVPPPPPSPHSPRRWCFYQKQQQPLLGGGQWGSKLPINRDYCWSTLCQGQPGSADGGCFPAAAPVQWGVRAPRRQGLLPEQPLTTTSQTAAGRGCFMADSPAPQHSPQQPLSAGSSGPCRQGLLPSHTAASDTKATVRGSRQPVCEGSQFLYQLPQWFGSHLASWQWGQIALAASPAPGDYSVTCYLKSLTGIPTAGKKRQLP